MTDAAVPSGVLPGGNRTPIGEDATRAAYEAHKHDHRRGGRPLPGCPTCRRYLDAVVTARTQGRP